jgi:cation:H+ antiporter
MDITLQILILLLSLVILGKSADIVIKNLVRISTILSWNTFVVAFIVLGVATSTPEFFVGINAAIDKTTQLSLGNVMGATIVLLGLVIGSTAYFSGKVALSHFLTKKEIFLMGIIILLPIFLLLDLEFSRIDAVVSACSYCAYIYYMYKSHTKHKRDHLTTTIQQISITSLQNSALMFLVGFVGVTIASRFAVNNALLIAETLNVPVLIIGVLVFSLGTNLPEIILAFTALRSKNKSIVLGNVLGSATTNTLVISLASIIHPTQINDPEVFITTTLFLFAMVIAFAYFIRSKSDISKEEGLILLGLYGLFVLTEIVTKIF